MSESNLPSHIDPMQISNDFHVFNDDAVSETNNLTAIEQPTAAAPTTPSANTVLTVAEQIEAVKATIEVKRTEIKERDAQIAEHEATQELLKEAQLKQKTIMKEVAELDKKKAQTVPEYESVKRNSFLRDDAAKLKADIEEHCQKLITVNIEAVALEAELSETSKQYKEETTKRNAFLKHVTDSIAALLEAIAMKIAVTSSGNGEILDAADSLEMLADTVRTRERQLASLEKETREHKHVCTIHDHNLAGLEGNTKEKIKRLREQKDETIREAVFSFQDERSRLHTDIEDMKRINKEQSTALTAGETQKDPQKEKGGFGKKSNLTTGTSPDEEALVERMEAVRCRNNELREEINFIKDEIRKATSTKAEAIRQSKQLELRTKKEAEAHHMTVAKIDNDIQASRLATIRVERDNDKIALQVKQMVEQVKSVKDANAIMENRTKPLPIE